MKIAIYQVNYDRDKNSVMYIPHDYLEQYQGKKEVDSSIYDRIFEGEVDCKNLIEVYEKHKDEPVKGSFGRRVSVSDVIKLYADIGTSYYYCDGEIGFTEIDFDERRCHIMTEKEHIDVLYVGVGKHPKKLHIENNLDAFQKLVGGRIEGYMPYEDDVALIVNATGKTEDLPLNRAIYSEDSHTISDIICGNFFIVSAPADSENFRSLPSELMEKYTEVFKNPEKFVMTKAGIRPLPYHRNIEKER